MGEPREPDISIGEPNLNKNGEDDDYIYECPECGYEIAKDDPICPHCGVLFID